MSARAKSTRTLELSWASGRAKFWRHAGILVGRAGIEQRPWDQKSELFALIRPTEPRWPLVADLEVRRVYFRTNSGVGEKGLRGSERFRGA